MSSPLPKFSRRGNRTKPDREDVGIRYNGVIDGTGKNREVERVWLIFLIFSIFPIFLIFTIFLIFLIFILIIDYLINFFITRIIFFN